MDGKIFFDKPVKSVMRTYNIQDIATGLRDDYIISETIIRW